MLRELIYLFFPINICLLLLTLGVFCLWNKSSFKAGRLLVSISFLFLFIFSSQPFSNFFLGNLEKKFSPLIDFSKLPVPAQSISYILVLGGLSSQNQFLPLTSQFSSTMLTRLIEGIRIHRQLPHTKLILSGGGDQQKSEAEIMKQLAEELGVDVRSIIIETQSSNTYEEGIYLKGTLNTEPFILVTSARHMPRAMTLFQKMGFNPIPAPTNHLIRLDSIHFINYFIPNVDYLFFTSAAVYEYFGLFKNWMKGRI